MSIPTSVTDNDILPAFQVFDADKIGVLEAEVILKSLTNVGEPLTDVEAKAFKDSMKINDQGQFDYNGRLRQERHRRRLSSIRSSRILSQVHPAGQSQGQEERQEEEEEEQVKPMGILLFPSI